MTVLIMMMMSMMMTVVVVVVVVVVTVVGIIKFLSQYMNFKMVEWEGYNIMYPLLAHSAPDEWMSSDICGDVIDR